MRKPVPRTRIIGIGLAGAVLLKAVMTLVLGHNFDPVLTGIHVPFFLLGVYLIWWK